MKHIRSLILALVLSAGLAPAFAQAPPPVPALPDTERRTSYVISASTCACNVGFQLYGDSTDVANWLTVYINGVEIPQSGNWNITSPTGSISTIPRPITNGVLTFTTARTGTVQIVGAQRPRRLSEFTENRGVAARDMNQVLNGIEAQLREMWDRQFRTVQAPPGETLAMLPPLASRVSMGACFNSSGNLAPCVAAAGTFAAGTGIGFTGSNPTTISYTGATYSAGNGITFTGTNPTVISANPATSIPVIATRAAALAQNLSAYTVILTTGYAAVGDAPVTKFKNVGSTPFLDSHVTAGSITAAGTAYTNGTYRGVAFTGGTGINFTATVVVAGGVVSSVTRAFNAGGFGYTVNDVLTTGAANIGGTGSGFTWTVSAVSTPLASFTDSSGAHWQYVPETVIDPRQFGAVFNWFGVDAGATDDQPSIQAALNFASYYKVSGFTTNGGNFGSTRVMLPAGQAMVCNALTVYGSTQFQGQGPQNSGLHMCDAWPSAAANFVTLCDPNVQIACFGTQILDMGLSATITAAANAGTYMLYSNAAQQQRAISNVSIYGGKRGCFRYDTGFGGAAIFTSHNLFCTVFSASLSDGVVINAGTTLIKFYDTVSEGSYSGNAANLIGGQITLDGFHTEGITTGINVSMATATHSATIMHASGGASCTELVKLQAANTLGNLAIYDAVMNGCTRLVTDGQPSGANRTTDAKPKDGWVFFNP